MINDFPNKSLHSVNEKLRLQRGEASAYCTKAGKRKFVAFPYIIFKRKGTPWGMYVVTWIYVLDVYINTVESVMMEDEELGGVRVPEDVGQRGSLVSVRREAKSNC